MQRPTYTLNEIQSYMPTGWELAGDAEPVWDEKKDRLTFTVLDSVDFDWPVHVSAADVEKHGRLKAFELAIDDVFRQRLGRHTRGLGLAG